jgi:8-oxo-dGTP diphosphatase
VLLVHRPKYNDWSFPKGKLEPGEDWREAAVREVEEETGLLCEAGPEIGRTQYAVRGEPKEVRYFRMNADQGGRPQNEVDGIRWATKAEASALLSHGHDRDLLDRWRDDG